MPVCSRWHPSCLLVIYPFSLYSLWVKSSSCSLLGSLRQNTCTGLRLVTLSITTSNRMIYRIHLIVFIYDPCACFHVSCHCPFFGKCFFLSVFSSIRVFVISARNTSKTWTPTPSILIIHLTIDLDNNSLFRDDQPPWPPAIQRTVTNANHEWPCRRVVGQETTSFRARIISQNMPRLSRRVFPTVARVWSAISSSSGCAIVVALWVVGGLRMHAAVTVAHSAFNGLWMTRLLGPNMVICFHCSSTCWHNWSARH